VLYRLLEHGCEFSRVVIWARRPQSCEWYNFSDLTRNRALTDDRARKIKFFFLNSNTYIQLILKETRRKKNSFSRMNAFYQERLFLFPPQINFVFLNTWGRLQPVYSFYSVLLQLNQKTFFLIFVFSHSKRGTTTAKQKIAISNVMRRTVTSCCFYRKLTWCSFLTDSQNITL